MLRGYFTEEFRIPYCLQGKENLREFGRERNIYSLIMATSPKYSVNITLNGKTSDISTLKSGKHMDL